MTQWSIALTRVLTGRGGPCSHEDSPAASPWRRSLHWQAPWGRLRLAPPPQWHPGHHSPVVPTSDHGRGAAVPFTEYSGRGGRQRHGRRPVRQPLHAARRGREPYRGHAQRGRPVRRLHPRQAANAVDLRYSIPDSAAGTGLTTPLKVLVNGRARPDLTLTSVYDWFYGSYPFTNDPSDLDGHHMYDDVQTPLGGTLPAGRRSGRDRQPVYPGHPRRRGLPGSRAARAAAARLDLGAVLRGGPDRPTRTRPPTSRTRSMPAARQERRSTYRRATSSSPRT